MANETHLGPSVGFRHLVEDGLTILSEKPLERSRQTYVLEDLVSLLNKTLRGSNLLEDSSLFASAEDKKAFATYTFFDRYLGLDLNEKGRKRILAATKAFKELQQGSKVSKEHREAAESLLNELLMGLKHKRGIGVPEDPEEIRILG